MNARIRTDKMIEVAAALIIRDGAVMIARRGACVPHPGKWEFPGGKIEPGETPRQCLAREIREEFDIIVEVGGFFADNVHRYDSKVIHLMAYEAVWTHGKILMKDHDQCLWVSSSDLLQYDLLPADVPIAQKLISHLDACISKPDQPCLTSGHSG